MNKYEELKELALKIHKAFMETENYIGLESIAIQLPNDFWMLSLRDLRNGDGYAEYHPERDNKSFKICNVTFYNDVTMPEYMKFKRDGT